MFKKVGPTQNKSHISAKLKKKPNLFVEWDDVAMFRLEALHDDFLLFADLESTQQNVTTSQSWTLSSSCSFICISWPQQCWRWTNLIANTNLFVEFVHFVRGGGRQARPDVVVARRDQARVRAKDSGRVGDLEVAEVFCRRNVGTQVQLGFQIAFIVVFVCTEKWKENHDFELLNIRLLRCQANFDRTSTTRLGWAFNFRY